MTSPRVAVVTPARDEETNLPRLIAAMTEQDLQPIRWTIVDTGSTDATLAVAFDAAQRHPWIDVVSLPAERRERGAPIVRAIEVAADAHLPDPPELLVNVDADVSFEPHFLRALSLAFDADPSLGIASGTCYERHGEAWRERFVTGSSAWGATRAYRWDCLQSVRPLEPRLGWDGIDELRAHARGWSTRTLRDLPFHHPREEGAREPRWNAFAAQGSTAHFMGYRHSYLLLRALHHARRHPSAIAMYLAFVGSAVTCRSRLADRDARAYLRRQQTLRALGQRAREAGGAPPAVRS
jgi:biofilm PGA synthesis N-glycosyltransferase PgaC